MFVLAVGGARFDVKHVPAFGLPDETLHPTCPEGSRPTRYSWTQHGRYFWDGCYYRYIECDACELAPENWYYCDDVGTKDYRGGKQCKNDQGCRCRMDFAGKLTCDSKRFYVWQKCPTPTYLNCVAQPAELHCPQRCDLPTSTHSTERRAKVLTRMHGRLRAFKGCGGVRVLHG